MLYIFAADVVVLIHFAFVLFVALGGFLAIRFNGIAWVHLPIAIYGATIEFVGFRCPLTPLENWLRQKGGQAGYASGFVEEYIMKALYPDGLTRRVQLTLGILVIVINVIAYTIASRHK